jgi:outer membrane biosynthesis protein TonB
MMTLADRKSYTQAFVAALLIEGLLVAGLVGYCLFHHETTHIKTETVIMLEPDVPLAPKPAAKPEPKPEPPKPKPLPPKVKTPEVVKQKMALPKPLPAVPKPAEEKALPTPVALPSAATEPAPPPPPVAPPVVSAVDPHVVSSYASKLLAAVQAATRCPDEAQFIGRVRVAFSLRDTQTSNIRIITPSGIKAIDNAALHAVLDANIPEPPSEMQGSSRSFQTWVDLSCR